LPKAIWAKWNKAFYPLLSEIAKDREVLSKLREIARGNVLDTFNPIEKEYVILIVAVPELNENQRNT